MISWQGAIETAVLSQDVFSMGCVLAELFLEGKALFDLSKVTLMQLMPIKPLLWPALQGACSVGYSES